MQMHVLFRLNLSKIVICCVVLVALPPFLEDAAKIIALSRNK
jgi:hypothetical protein